MHKEFAEEMLTLRESNHKLVKEKQTLKLKIKELEKENKKLKSQLSRRCKILDDEAI